MKLTETKMAGNYASCYWVAGVQDLLEKIVKEVYLTGQGDYFHRSETWMMPDKYSARTGL